MNHEAELTAIAGDLELCDLMEAVGDTKAKRRATAHRKACMDRLHEMNVEDGISEMSIEEIMAELEI